MFINILQYNMIYGPAKDNIYLSKLRCLWTFNLIQHDLYIGNGFIYFSKLRCLWTFNFNIILYMNWQWLLYIWVNRGVYEHSIQYNIIYMDWQWLTHFWINWGIYEYSIQYNMIYKLARVNIYLGKLRYVWYSIQYNISAIVPYLGKLRYLWIFNSI